MAQTHKNEEQLATAPIGRLMLKLAVPTVAAQLINMLYNIVDRIYIGHIPEVGSTALTGVGVTFPIITLVSAFAAFAGQGGAPLPVQGADGAGTCGTCVFNGLGFIQNDGREMQPGQRRRARGHAVGSNDGVAAFPARYFLRLP